MFIRTPIRLLRSTEVFGSGPFSPLFGALGGDVAVSLEDQVVEVLVGVTVVDVAVMMEAEVAGGTNIETEEYERKMRLVDVEEGLDVLEEALVLGFQI